MSKKFFTLVLVSVLFVFTACNSNVDTKKINVNFLVSDPPEAELKICQAREFDSVMIGRVVYEDSSPYKRGSVKAQGDDWESVAVTGDDGGFELGVAGDSRFIFSAYSPFGDNVFYVYAEPLVIPKYSTSEAIICQFGIDIVTCYEDAPI